VIHALYRFCAQQPGSNCVIPCTVPKVTSPTHWLVGAKSLAVDVQATACALAPAGSDGQPPAGGPVVAEQFPLVTGALQKRSFEYVDTRQKPPPLAQSASDRQGAQKLPLPTQEPARGAHTESGTHVWSFAPGSQSASLPHSGVHAPALQCWNVPSVGGQSSSLLHACAAQAFPDGPDAQCCGLSFCIGQSESTAQVNWQTPATQT
jgi:hypothetical protein